MLGASYVDVGAGVTVSGDYVYYTLDVAYIPGAGNYSPPATITPGGPTPLPYYAVQTVTPMPDGSIVHVVQPGQNLILIAKAYGVLVIEIKSLNNLTSDNIYVGDKLIIRKASPPGPTSTEIATSTPTRAATPTRYPTRTPTPSVTPTASSTVAVLAEAISQSGGKGGLDNIGNVLVIAIIAMAAGGVILMIAGSLLKRQPKQPVD
jgi:LysM repeat protein